MPLHISLQCVLLFCRVNITTFSGRLLQCYFDINFYEIFLANNVPNVTLPEDPSIVNETLRVHVGVQTNITLIATDPDGENTFFNLVDDPSFLQPSGVMIENGKKFIF